MAAAHPANASRHGCNHEEQCRELFRILDEPIAETGWLWEAGDAAGVALWIPPDGEARFLEIELRLRTDDRRAAPRIFDVTVAAICEPIIG